MKAIEILGMKQARAWEMASLNEFRKFFGLKEHQTFEDINPDKHVAEQLKNLYETPGQVELYTGLITEGAKTPMSKDDGGPVGVGISPTYTISRAILSDAVALVRGDRFYTVSITAAIQSVCPELIGSACFRSTTTPRTSRITDTPR